MNLIIQGIYAIQCTVNGKMYVGSSKNIAKRWFAHKRSLQNGTHDNIKLSNAWNKHGESNFVWLILECVSDASMLTTREQYWLDEYDAYNSGYNRTKMVNRIVFTEEVRRKMSEAAKRNKNNLGNKHTDDAKQKISEAAKLQMATTDFKLISSKVHKALWANPEYRNNILEARKDHMQRLREFNIGNKYGTVNKGKPKSEYYKKKRSEAIAIKKSYPGHTKNSDETWVEYKARMEAATNISDSIPASSITSIIVGA
jgi:group I intron endonuclease